MSLHLAVALRDWRPEAVAEAERGLLDFVTFDDPLVSGYDAVLQAARLAPLTRRIGLVPTVTVTHTEPFHVAIGIQTLDHISRGRAGWLVRVSEGAAELFGRRDEPSHDDLHAEAEDVIEVARRLWDSWEDDAEIRDSATGRFVDRDKLHYTGFEGRFFSVKGPSITPRSPQGQPLVAASRAYRGADLVFTSPEEAVGGGFADLDVRFGGSGVPAAFTGTPVELAELLLGWHERGVRGFRLRPGRLPYDLEGITRELTAELRARGAFRHAYEADTLRGLLGLPRPASRYASEVAV